MRLVGRYRDAIEADLADAGHDLFVLFQARRWRRLLVLIDGLPRTSRLAEAQNSDIELVDELAAYLDEHPDFEPPSRREPKLTEYSAEVDALYVVADRVAEVVRAVGQSLGGKKQARTPAMPRPRNVWDQAKNRRRVAQHHALTARLLPNGPQPLPASSRAAAAPSGRPRAAGLRPSTPEPTPSAPALPPGGPRPAG